MKKIFLMLLISGLQYSIFAQCGTGLCNEFFVKTPNLSNVKACSSGCWPDDYVARFDADTRGYAISSAHIYEGGTNDYNCHGYAWHVKEGGNRVWINNLGEEVGNVNAYWIDNSYTLYNKYNNPHNQNLKVFYGSDDHSAITTSDPNVFISKMGAGCLVAHRWDNSPYNASNLRYYSKYPALTFYISHNVDPLFGTTPNNYVHLSLSSVNGVVPTYLNGYSWAWYVHLKGGWEENWQVIDVTRGANQATDLHISANTIYYGDLDIEIKCVGENGVTGQRYTAYGTIRCYDCQFSTSWIKSGAMIAYPNPVSDILNVDLDQLLTIESQQATTNGKQIKQGKTFDVRLYDGQGNLLRHKKTQGGKVEFDVSTLPNGIYHLHIYDGVNSKPEMRQVVVEH